MDCYGTCLDKNFLEWTVGSGAFNVGPNIAENKADMLEMTTKNWQIWQFVSRLADYMHLSA